MTRTTIVADPDVLDRLRELAHERGVSFAEVAREALAAKAAEYNPPLTCLGSGASGRSDLGRKAGVGRVPARPWR